MKRVTASEARRNWFRILDEVAAGAVVVIERGGRRIVIQREEEARPVKEIPDYGPLISAPEADRAEEWSWDWKGPEEELSLAEAERPSSGEESSPADEDERSSGDEWE